MRVLAAILLSNLAYGASVMHCFAWTAKPEATPSDWEAFQKASDVLPSKIPGVLRVWYGPLASRLSQVSIDGIDKASYQKMQAGEQVTSPVKRLWRQYGMCMEMKDAAALKAYDSDPYHQQWAEIYSKVRVDGTTTFDIVGK
jgi:hypothetical protein